MKVGIPAKSKTTSTAWLSAQQASTNWSAEGTSDEDFRAAGAQILGSADPEEYSRLRRDQVLFTYLHLAASKECTDALLASKTTSIAYETVPDALRRRPAPYHLMRRHGGGRGVLMGGVPGVRPAKVVVIGAGVSGKNAIAVAYGMQADVTVLDLSIARLREIGRAVPRPGQDHTSNSLELEQAVLDADLVIGAVLVPGAKAPTLVSNSLVARMKPGSVLVDIAIDQGRLLEDSHATTHADPTYHCVHGSVFYCVLRTSLEPSPYVDVRAPPTRRFRTSSHWQTRDWSTHDGLLLADSVAAAHGYSATTL
ncbi:unnamed protein product, partial [Mesorhabditis spiculigera]